MNERPRPTIYTPRANPDLDHTHIADNAGRRLSQYHASITSEQF